MWWTLLIDDQEYCWFCPLRDKLEEREDILMVFPPQLCQLALEYMKLASNQTRVCSPPDTIHRGSVRIFLASMASLTKHKSEGAGDIRWSLSKSRLLLEELNVDLKEKSAETPPPALCLWEKFVESMILWHSNLSYISSPFEFGGRMANFTNASTTNPSVVPSTSSGFTAHNCSSWPNVQGNPDIAGTGVSDAVG